MLDRLIKDLSEKGPLNELSNHEWLALSIAFADDERDESDTKRLIDTLSQHSGIPAQFVQNTFDSLNGLGLTKDQQAELLLELQHVQHQATAKIILFMDREFFKSINLDSLTISRTSWNTLISKFEKQQKEHISPAFFLITLSEMLKISVDNLIAILRSRHQPDRGVKRQDPDEHHTLRKKRFCFLADGEDTASLIFTSSTVDSQLDAELADKNVRRVDNLRKTTPLKGEYSVVLKTPGSTMVRPLYGVKGGAEYTLLKYLSPLQDTTNRGRVNCAPNLFKEHILEAIPKLHINRAGPVEYTATLDKMITRSGAARRRSARAMTGASATEVFKAHGIEIVPADGNSHHWSHLVAHFLASNDEITPVIEDQEVVNITPTTATANYNTLFSVERYIAELLESKITDKVHILVAPSYSNEHLIADSLVYTLSWKNQNDHDDAPMNKEEFHINPKSFVRHTQRTNEVIRLMRCRGLFFSAPNDTAAPVPNEFSIRSDGANLIA